MRVCNLNTTWATTGGAPGDVIVRDVVCYNVTGAMAPTDSLLTYPSKY